MEHEERFKRNTGIVISPATFFIGLIAVIFLFIINFWIIQFICQINSRIKRDRYEETACMRCTNQSITTRALQERNCGENYVKAIQKEKKIDQDYQNIVKKYTDN